MQILSCLIADDEPHARNLIKSYIEKVPYLHLVAECKDANEVLGIFKNKQVEIAFLDIQMPGMLGVDLAKIIKNETKIVFTTAFDEYAIEGYKVNAVGYLLKPFSFDEFLEVTQKIYSQDTKKAPSSEKPDFLMVKADYKIHQIPLNDILYFEGLKDYAKIYRKSVEKPILSLMTLKSVEEKLEHKNFMRLHRSFVVNMDNVELIERNQIVFGKTRITVSEKYKDVFQEFIKTRYE
ncbi:LytR/AlgR family response regulator transcription factor [Galbibacter mesophilus]|uniref:LytR/AlgR family response regulator transcription factor n=1 Tax=Galbibacter mesophilus TaxID=379069 RepID=UPI00191C953A|nr:LytTR family DNA-binding domain-containing protein [Galbibacter mesophilus]MCM5663009.1 LytTR family DNA-binding domain-containing protein [Galbibacter mesophilus]